MAHHLNEACGLQMQKDVWDDISSAQHTLQAIRLQDAVQLRQKEEHVVDKPENFQNKAVVRGTLQDLSQIKGNSQQ